MINEHPRRSARPFLTSQRPWALDRVTICPQRISVIAAAALVLVSLDRGSR
jgi:hypothetical protein